MKWKSNIINKREPLPVHTLCGELHKVLVFAIGFISFFFFHEPFVLVFDANSTVFQLYFSHSLPNAIQSPVAILQRRKITIFYIYNIASESQRRSIIDIRWMFSCISIEQLLEIDWHMQLPNYIKHPTTQNHVEQFNSEQLSESERC